MNLTLKQIFQELNVNYRTIILPEALKIIQSGDPSGFDVIAGLSSILGETGQSLDSLISQLETLHRNAVMGIKVGFDIGTGVGDWFGHHKIC